MKTFILAYRWVIVLTVLTITGCLSLLLVLLSFGGLRNFCQAYITRYTSIFLMRITGFKAVYQNVDQLPKEAVLLTFNHNSFLDIFLLTGMGRADSRYILSTKTLIYLPLVISAKAIGTFYIPMKKEREKRLRFFRRVTEFFKKNKLSVFASSEGVHNHKHGIAPFNRGVYHMAKEANLPVALLYIHIPEESNPLQGKTHAKGGTIRLEYLETVETKDWDLEKLDDHIDAVRNIFVKRFKELNP